MPGDEMKKLLATLWSSWKEVAAYLADFQARWLLTIFYFTFGLLFGLLARLLADPLHTRQQLPTSGWLKRHQQEDTLSAAGQQF